MPILDMDNDVDDIVEEHTYVSQEEMKTSVIFNKEQDVNDIVQYVSGYKWEVTYFNQIREVNDPPRNPDIGLSNTIQKYNRINNLIIYLEGGINQDDPDNITGNGYINIYSPPSVGDAFIATILGGREALFVITSVTNKTYNTKAVFDIEFSLFLFLENDTEYYNDLVHKTVKEYYYDKSYIVDASAPIIYAEEYKKKLTLKNEIPNIIKHYLDNYFSNDVNFIKLATTTSTYIDFYLSDFILKIIDRNVDERLSRLMLIDYRDTDVKYTIWELILDRNIENLPLVDKDMGFTYTPSVYSVPQARHISYLDIDFIVRKLKGHRHATYTLVDNPIHKDDIEQPLKDTKYYIFSNDFYSGNYDDMTYVEKALYNYISGKSLDNDIVYKMLTEYKYWNLYDKYYLLPILVIFIKDKIRHTYSDI